MERGRHPSRKEVVAVFRRRFVLILGVIVLGSPLVGVSAASAKDGDVIVRAGCSAGSEAKLKLSEEDGGIETEFEVDQSRNGVRWAVTMSANGTRVFRGSRVTRAPSGSFEVRRVVSSSSGRISARAVSPTGEVCSVRGSFRLS
jgi:hypothetical protein